MSRINHVWLATYEFGYPDGTVIVSTVALTRSRNARLLIPMLTDNPGLLMEDDSPLCDSVVLTSLVKVPLGRGNIDSVVEHLDGLAADRADHADVDSDADSAAIDAGEGVLMLDEVWHMVSGVHNARSVSPVPAESTETPSESVDEAPSSPLSMDLSALNDSPFRGIGLPSERDITPPVSSSPTHSSRERVDRALDAMSEAIESLREYLSDRDDQ